MALCAHCTGTSYGDIVSVMPLGLRQDLVAHYALHSSLFTLRTSLFTLHSSLFTLVLTMIFTLVLTMIFTLALTMNFTLHISTH
jgi:hypothetical protein